MKHEMTGGRENNLVAARFMEKLRQHPELLERFQSILDLTDNTQGPLKTADEVEELLIQELRQLGSTTMNQWAVQAEVRVSEELKGQDATVRSRKKNVNVVVRLWVGESTGSDMAQPEEKLPTPLAEAIGGKSTRKVSPLGTDAHGLW